MSTPRRYELSDFEWSIIQPLLPNKPRGKPRAERDLLAPSHGVALGRHPGALRSADDLRQPFPALGQDRRVGPHLRGSVAGL